MSADDRSAAAPSRSIGVVLVGGARTHQEIYGPLFLRSSRCRVIGLTGDGAETPEEAHRLDELARELDVPRIDSLTEALARDDVALASVTVAVERRADAAIRCVEAKKHVYLDKPIASSPADAVRIARACAAHGVLSQMFSFVHADWAASARAALETGRLGDLRAIHCDVLFAKGRPSLESAGARREVEEPVRFTFPTVKRELFTTGVYALSLVRWLSGREVRRVTAVTGNHFFAEHLAQGVEDFGAGVLDLDGDLSASFTAGRVGWWSAPGGGALRLRLVGDAGVETFDAWSPRIEVRSERAARALPPRHPEDPMGFWVSTQRDAGAGPRTWTALRDVWAARDVEEFLGRVADGRPSEVTAADGARTLDALFACYRSAARGVSIDLRESGGAPPGS